MSGKFFKTTPEIDHQHIIYVNADEQIGYCSYDEGHTHDVVFPQQQPGMPPASFNLGPASVNDDPFEAPHVHEVLPYRPRYRKTKKSDEDITKEVYELFREAYELERDAREDGNECFDFYMGKQWDESLVDELNAQKRSAITINKIQKYTNDLIGYQRQNRTDLHYVPVEGGDQKTADMLNILVKNILSSCYFDREESKVFKDEVVTGRGIYEIIVDTMNNIQGEIKVVRFPRDAIVFGPHIQEDLADCEYFVKYRPYSLARLKVLYPEQADKLEKGLGVISLNTGEEIRYKPDQWAHDKESSGYSASDDKLTLGGLDLIDIQKKTYYVLELVRKVYNKVFVAVNESEDLYLNLHGWDKADIARVETLGPDFLLLSKPSYFFEISRVCGGIVLAHESPADLPSNNFHTFPVYAEKEGDYFRGRVHSAIDPQIELNKRRSQAIDIVNKMAAFGYFTEEGMFISQQEEENFTKNSSSPGFVAKLKDINRRPVPTEGVRFPTEVAELIKISDADLNEFLSVRVEQGGANTSSAALLQWQKMQLVGTEYLFDSLSFAKRQIGRLLIPIIQKYYTPERIKRVLVNQNAKGEVQLGGTPLAEVTDADINYMLSTVDLANYDVEAAEVASSPTARITTFMAISELLRGGGQVPPQLFVELADIPQETKDKILKGMAEQAQAAQAEAETKSKQEINKTLIAQGIIPPEVEQQLQQQQQPQQPEGNNGQEFALPTTLQQ